LQSGENLKSSSSSDVPLLFGEERVSEEEDSRSEIVMIPFATIARFEKVDRQNTTFMFGGENSYSVDIYTKDFRRSLRFGFDPNKHSRLELCNILARCIFPRTLADIFAYNPKQLPCIDPVNGWDLYDPFAEYKRLGVGESDYGWCFTDINQSYALSETYPKVLVVPANLSDEDLMVLLLCLVQLLIIIEYRFFS
jgi:myotubularin-related protein 1/2